MSNIDIAQVKMIIETNMPHATKVLKVSQAVAVELDNNNVIKVCCRAVIINERDEWADHSFFKFIINNIPSESIKFFQFEPQHEYDDFEEFMKSTGLHVIQL